MDISCTSINILKQWSNKTNFNVIFDSDVDGDGSNNVLNKIVMNKSNLYFITLDENNNVFGGYINVKIIELDEFSGFISDDNAFIFSLIKDGKVKNTKYSIKSDDFALYLHRNDLNDYLYDFGDDICVNRIGNSKSYCQCGLYDYYIENPFIGSSHPINFFQTKRIIVIEMN
ncbi:TLDc domain-containing protein [Entamoeba marina]